MKQPAAESADFQLRLPCEPGSVPRARARLRDWLGRAGVVRDLIADVQLAVTEAAANAVLHADCDDFEVQGRITDETLLVSVWDRGQGRPAPTSGAGLGTRIIRALAEAVDIEHTQPGTRVTMCFLATPTRRA